MVVSGSNQRRRRATAAKGAEEDQWQGQSMTLCGSETAAATRIRIKRIYRAPRNSDGKRILVDRIWPRGMTRERARLHLWLREVAPTEGLRRWFHENPAEWHEFKMRYLGELEDSPAVRELVDLALKGVVTLLYASANEVQNNAAVLKEYLLERTAPDR